MAIQAGAFPFTGSIGGVTGYKRGDKYYLKEKNVLTRERVLTDDRFARTRENAKEFRRAVRAGMLVRHCLDKLTHGMELADTHISGRLNGLLTKVVKSDPKSDRGERLVSKGQVAWLDNFVFQKEKAFSSVFKEVPRHTIDAGTGRMKVEIGPFDPRQGIIAPEGATHVKLLTCAAAIHFEEEQHHWEYKETGYLPLGECVSEAICLEHALEAKEGQSLLLAMGVVFYRQAEDGHFLQVDGGVMRILQAASPSPSGGGELVSPEVIHEPVVATALHVAVIADAACTEAFAEGLRVDEIPDSYVLQQVEETVVEGFQARHIFKCYSPPLTLCVDMQDGGRILSNTYCLLLLLFILFFIPIGSCAS